MSGIDISQHSAVRVILSIKQSGVSVVSETPIQILIEHRCKGGRGWSSLRIICSQHSAVRNRLKMRHHQRCRHSLFADVGT